MYSDFEYDFEELPAFRDGDRVAGFLDGTARIDFYDDGTWTVGAISLKCQSGDDEFIQLDADEQRKEWLHITDELERAGNVRQEIYKRLEDDGIIIPDDNAEHRLTARDYGVGRAA